VLNFTATTAIDTRGIGFNGRSALSSDSSDGFLRLNASQEFTNGITTPGKLAANGGLFVTPDNGIKNVTGEYGTVQTTGTTNGFGGYSINGQYVLMSELGNTVGIYNDIDNEYMLRCIRNSYTELHVNGASRARTDSTYGLNDPSGNGPYAHFSTTTVSTATSFPTGHQIICFTGTGSQTARNSTLAPRISGATNSYVTSGAGSLLAGTWRSGGASFDSTNEYVLARRSA
jgi:hypothetical protein